MKFNSQKVLPAIRGPRHLEKFLDSPHEFGVFLDVHIAQLKPLMELTHKKNKKIFIHADLIQGLKNDEYSTEFLCQEMKPYGIVSTRTNVIVKAKQKGVVAVLRIFLLDSHALEKSFSILRNVEPDFVEILPGVMPTVIKEIVNEIRIPILTGGFVRTVEDVEHALQAGVTAVTTSKIDLWNISLSKY